MLSAYEYSGEFESTQDSADESLMYATEHYMTDTRHDDYIDDLLIVEQEIINEMKLLEALAQYRHSQSGTLHLLLFIFWLLF